ncbi:MAG: RluA family pseudouridine synthase, partial [Chloroflexi bacterium]|nr:RluA family pseudouridine synthase [Chloroflexota bacterium]
MPAAARSHPSAAARTSLPAAEEQGTGLPPDILDLTATQSWDRLDRFLVANCGLSRSALQHLIRDGRVTLEGRAARPGIRLRSGDRVIVRPRRPEPVTLQPEEIPIPVVYEDADLIVVNKPPALVVHPGPGHPSGTLVNALLARCRDLAPLAGDLRPGIVHRLDRDTSGILVVAKHDASYQALADQFRQRHVQKAYLVLVRGSPQSPEGTVEAPLGRHPRHRQRMAIVPTGRPARTSYRLLEPLPRCSLLRVEPETGRTHQIRVHLASIGLPILGDRIYG